LLREVDGSTDVATVTTKTLAAASSLAGERPS
jgi:hypothetical protein